MSTFKVPCPGKLSTEHCCQRGGRKGVLISATLSTDAGSVAGGSMEARNAGDFRKANNAFKMAATTVERLTTAKALEALKKP